MKKCCKCKKLLPKSAFSRDRTKKDNLQTRCKSCHNAYTKQHYEKNKPKYIERSLIRKEHFRTIIRFFKEKCPCKDCGKYYPYYVVSFDHRNPTDKKFELSKVSKISSLSSLLKELEKCDVVCLNCHSVRSSKQFFKLISFPSKQRNTKIVQEIKENNVCTDCGIDYEWFTLTFDHLDPLTKRFNISKGKKEKATKTLLAEIEKCEIVCCNCHAIRTFKRLQET